MSVVRNQLSEYSEKQDPEKLYYQHLQHQQGLDQTYFQNLPKIDSNHPVSCYIGKSTTTSRSKKQQQKIEKKYQKRIKEEKNKYKPKLRFSIDENLTKIENITKYKRKFPDFIIPGTDKINKQCTEFIGRSFCKKCGYLHLWSQKCNSPKCPIHATPWRYKRTKTIFERIYSHKLQYKLRSGHLIV